MSDVVIRCENLGKLYRIGKRESYRTLRDTLTDSLSFPFRRLRSIWKIDDPDPLVSNNNNLIWALKNLFFEIKQGDVVGIIGRNGAGKTTLLKILSRITEPTEGQVKIQGRVGSLLEVGTGFHPELTGRENIYLNAAILGMKRVEISRKFDEIVAFAEIEKFLDTPVKHYSSGMYVRLAFAVAAHLDPDILLVDEVLAVGDAAFQKKCLGKMGDVAQEGRTVLFVSHNMQAVSTLTNQSFLLFEGRCIYNGPTDKTIAQYIHSISNDNLIYLAQPSSSIPTVTKVELLTSSPNNIQLNGGPMQVVFKINLPRVIKGGRFSFQIFNSLQQPIMHLPVVDGELPLFHEPGEYQLKCQIPKVRLYVGNYTLTVHFGGPKGGEKFETIQDICPFEVVTTKELHDGFWQPGTCAYVEEYEWSLTRI